MMAGHYHVYFATRRARRLWTDERFVYRHRQDAQRAANAYQRERERLGRSVPPWFTVRACSEDVCPTEGDARSPRMRQTPSGGEYQR